MIADANTVCPVLTSRPGWIASCTTTTCPGCSQLSGVVVQHPYGDTTPRCLFCLQLPNSAHHVKPTLILSRLLYRLRALYPHACMLISSACATTHVTPNVCPAVNCGMREAFKTVYIHTSSGMRQLRAAPAPGGVKVPDLALASGLIRAVRLGSCCSPGRSMGCRSADLHCIAISILLPYRGVTDQIRREGTADLAAV